MSERAIGVAVFFSVGTILTTVGAYLLAGIGGAMISLGTLAVVLAIISDSASA